MVENVPPAPLSLRKRILFSAILIVLLGLILETGACVYLKATRGYDGEHLMQYGFDPYKNMRLVPGYVDSRGIRHNAQGFRHDGPVSRRKADDTTRIFLMGASTAYGLGGLWPHIQDDFPVIDNDDLISAYLQRQLESAYPGRRFEVINAAITSTWSHHHLIYLNQSILGYDPDVVVLLDGFNDYYRDLPDHDQFASYAYGEHSQVIMGPPTLRSLAKANGWWFFRKSRFVHVAGRAGRTAKQLFAGEPEQPPIDVDANYAIWSEVFDRSALAMNRRIAALLDVEGVQALFVQQPMLIFERDRLETMPGIERKLFEFNVESYRPNYEEFVGRAAVEASRRMGPEVRRFGARFLDARDVFGPDVAEQIFTDYCHLTPEGNDRLARAILDGLKPLLEAAAWSGDPGGAAAPTTDTSPVSDAAGG